MGRMMLVAFYLYVLVQFSTAQFNNNCKWNDFSLQGAQGYEIQCVDEVHQYAYTPCMSYVLCRGQRYQGVYFNRSTSLCEYYLSEWDDGATIPEYANIDGIDQWTFNYDNGESKEDCPGGKIQFHITWICDPNAQPFSLQTTCDKVNDCNHNMQIKSVYACVQGPPPTNCIYPNLDISKLNGLNIQCVYDNDPSMLLYYRPCQSDMPCSWGDTNTYMVTQNYLSGNCAAGIAQYDANVLPQEMTVNGQEAYELSYSNGESSFGCFEPRRLNLTFICDPNADPYDMNGMKCGEYSTSICAYYLEIPTVYACNAECIWDVDGYRLDLRNMSGQILTGISNDNPSQQYTISPCNNLINCGEQNDYIMSSILDDNSQCIHILGRWDSGITEPTYIINEKKWQFIYLNGDDCNGYQSVYTIFWKCNQFVSGGKIGFAKQTATCQFEIEIESELACV